MTSLSGLKTCSLPWFPFESFHPDLISMEKILPMGISRLSRKFLIVPPNLNTFAFTIIIYFITASGLVGSGSFVTYLNSAKRGPTCSKRIIPNSTTKHPSFPHLRTWSLLFSSLKVLPLALFQMDEPAEILSQYLSLRSLFPMNPFLRTLTRIRCYLHCFRNHLYLSLVSYLDYDHVSTSGGGEVWGRDRGISLCPFLKPKHLGHLLYFRWPRSWSCTVGIHEFKITSFQKMNIYFWQDHHVMHRTQRHAIHPSRYPTPHSRPCR